MRIKDILLLESTNRDRLVLFKEGVFWRACQASGYLFVHLIHVLEDLRSDTSFFASLRLAYIPFFTRPILLSIGRFADFRF